jgi:hypothetical protein
MKISSITRKDPVQKARTQCRKKFLFYFKKGFADPTYQAWERDYKLDAHINFQESLHRAEYLRLLNARQYSELAQRIVRIESRTNLLFSFEKMALRDAVKTPEGARSFATGLYNYLYGSDPLQQRFEEFTQTLDSLPRIQTRVLTWPLQTVFGFIGNPNEHIFLKPRVTRIAAEKYAFDLHYASRPNWETYQSLLDFSAQIKMDMDIYKPRDYIDLQSFIWVMGSDEYPD